MSLILNIRGTNGSGKSTLARKLLGPDPLPQILTSGKRFTVSSDNRVAAAGLYKIATGGCDGLPTQEDICETVRYLASRPYSVVVFEGVVVSTIYQRYLDLDLELSALGHTFVWVCMATPLAECFRRIYARNKGTPIKEWKVETKHASHLTSREKAIAAGRWVMDYGR